MVNPENWTLAVTKDEVKDNIKFEFEVRWRKKKWFCIILRFKDKYGTCLMCLKGVLMAFKRNPIVGWETRLIKFLGQSWAGKAKLLLPGPGLG